MRQQLIQLGAICAITTASLGAGSGCFLTDSNQSSLLNLFGGHHGTPEGHELPDLGREGKARNFTTDMGWDIQLTESIITTTKVEVVSCDGSTVTPIDMYWGDVIEDFIYREDGSSTALGAVQTPDGSYCTLRVTFGPFDPNTAPQEDMASRLPPRQDPPPVVGNSMVIRGSATNADGEKVHFNTMSSDTFVANLDLREAGNGNPLKLNEEPVAVQIIVAKVYDQFFDGIDFNDFTETELKEAVKTALTLDTMVQIKI